MKKLTELKNFEVISQSIKKSLLEEKNPIKDDNEISRGKGYAFFQELKESDVPISISRFKQILRDKGITEDTFQEKVLTVILQHRAGIQFGIIGFIGMSLLPENGDIPKYILPPEKQNTQLDVIDTQKIEFNINTQVTSISDQETPLVNVNIKFTITPDDFVVNHFKVETLNKSPEALEIFELLKLQEDSLLQKIINWFKKLLGFHIKNEIHPNSSLEKTYNP